MLALGAAMGMAALGAYASVFCWFVGLGIAVPHVIDEAATAGRFPIALSCLLFPQIVPTLRYLEVRPSLLRAERQDRLHRAPAAAA